MLQNSLEGEGLQNKPVEHLELVLVRERGNLQAMLACLMNLGVKHETYVVCRPGAVSCMN